MEFVPLVVASALTWKIVSMVKFISAGDRQKALTQFVTWVAGVGVATLLAYSDFAGAIEFGGITLADANPASIILFGVALGSTAAAAYDSLSKNPEPKLGG